MSAPVAIRCVDTEPLVQGEDFKLEVNHKNKILEDCNEANLELLCIPCHKEEDLQTDKGVSKIVDPFGYGFSIMNELLSEESECTP